MILAGNKTLLWASLMAVLLSYLCDVSQASSFDCCLGYTERQVPVKWIRDYTEQWSYEACDIDAIIFYARKHIVCADPSELWVKNAIKILRRRKMSKLLKWN
ncbi:C-C motif chemokine 20 isoform X2 [Macrotis lagotis]|uniref:C-C motif chemokine 20 isoform X2 n=1 Tax=Macrotis lagotis TaxID=92651 RepID=UPI003D69FAF8